MEWWLLGLTVVLGIIMLVGIGLALVNLPGVIVVYISVFISAWLLDFKVITWNYLIIMGLITVASFVIDNLTVAYGAKKFGASKWGIVGAFVGGIVGVIVGNIVGAIIGPFIGAALMEYFIAKKEKKQALKAGFGSFLGFLSAVVIRFGIATAMFITWITLLIRQF